MPLNSILLPDLIRALPGFEQQPQRQPLPETPITGIALDSRHVQPGNIFVALEGGSVDGHRYIPAAILRGAVVVVGTQAVSGLEVPYVHVPDGRLALAILSAVFYGFPARRMTVIGVTGTDGKTTTSNLIYQILKAAGIKAGMISTVSALIGDEVLDTGFHVTTPEAPDVQRYLAQMVARGLTHVVLEATSHGLAQGRVAACDFDLGVVTNITHEHLDYHGSYAAYRQAKASLLTGLAETPRKEHGNYRVAILNQDDESYEFLADLLRGADSIRRVSYGLNPSAAVRAEQVDYLSSGTSFHVVGQGFSFPVESRLLGEYNVSNCLAAAALAVEGLGLPAGAIQEGILSLPGIPGRLEPVEMGQEFRAMVDFAHTPNALRRVLQTVRLITPGRIIAIFGSAGLRDRAKRHMMAEISAELADLTVLTAEDPRTESLDDILAEMAAGADSRGGVEGKTYWRVPDRGEAIRFALRLARPGDLVIALGKGHEQSMCFGETEYAWDDRVAMRAALAEYLDIPGPKMPYLPTQKKKE